MVVVMQNIPTPKTSIRARFRGWWVVVVVGSGRGGGRWWVVGVLCVENEHTRSFSVWVGGGCDAEHPPTPKTRIRARFRGWWVVVVSRPHRPENDEETVPPRRVTRVACQIVVRNRNKNKNAIGVPGTPTPIFPSAGVSCFRGGVGAVLVVGCHIIIID